MRIKLLLFVGMIVGATLAVAHLIAAEAGSPFTASNRQIAKPTRSLSSVLYLSNQRNLREDFFATGLSALELIISLERVLHYYLVEK